MISGSETDLICDLAETYGILDYKALPVNLLAALSAGLRENSRSKIRLSGMKVGTETMLLAAMADRLSFLCWAQTSDAQKGYNRPKSILSELSEDKETEGDVKAFNSAEEYEKARSAIIERERNARNKSC